MPPTRREQIQLDELLSDIYRGIETLPDKSAPGNSSLATTSNKLSSNNNGIYSRTHVKEYELPASDPLVQQHQREIKALRNQQSAQNYSSNLPAASKPVRSTLKRQTPDSSQQQRNQPQSLASYITSSATPENRRRVRIIDHPDKVVKGSYSSDDYDDNEVDFERQPRAQTRGTKGGKVKYVNTNKLIYHQERDPGEQLSDSDENNNRTPLARDGDDDDIDGVSRVEYYHTTWLGRQLGRASKRRSSKELTERQAKEKAMIEELKRSLRNGAITLKQSFRGNKNKNKSSELFDDHAMLNQNNDRYKQSTVIGSGLATVPRNYNKHSNSSNYNTSNNNNFTDSKPKYSEFDSVYRTVDDDSDYLGDPTNKNRSSAHKDQPAYTYKLSSVLQNSTTEQPNKQTSDSYSSATAPRGGYNSKASTSQPLRQQVVAPPSRQAEQVANHSRTLPHNYLSSSSPKAHHHQLLQSHYKGGTLNSTPIATPSTNTSNYSAAPDNMRNPNYMNNCVNTANTITTGSIKSPSQYTYNQQNALVNPQPTRTGETISSIPSATEVVRSALSRSGSQVSLNQLNKTINLLPNSPSPMTPTQNLRACSPSLSPSPLDSRPGVASPHYSSKICGSPYSYNQQQQQHQHQQQQQQQQQQQPSLPGMTRVIGTRTIEKAPSQQQQVYANPHASLMQHRQEQQMRQPNQNQASIREFNELDSLLRSLGPGVTTHVTPGFSSKPTQATFGGYGYNPVQQPPQPQAQPGTNLGRTDMYAKVQKSTPQEQPKPNYLQQHYGGGNIDSSTSAPYTIDVTNKKNEQCLQKQDISEFEPPTELLPSMEDYQNISKLNPVKNHYWYKPNMSRDRAINLLRDKPQGTFIVRDSTTFKGGFGLAVKVSKLPKNVLNNASLRNPSGDPEAELIRHFLIEQTADGGVILKGYSNEPAFSSLANLIYQHSLTEIALPCKLVIPRADIEDPKFNQKQKRFFEEFLASKEQAKHNPYDRTSPNGGYRRYPGDVYVHNEHRIIFE